MTATLPASPADEIKDTSLDHLPLNIAFSAAYLDGVMEHEHPEVAGKWKNVRQYLVMLKDRKP